MKKIIGLTAISLALGAAATFGSVASAQWGGWDGVGGWDGDGTTVVVRTGDNNCGWNNGCGWNRCGINRCGINRCGWNRCGINRCGCGVGGWGVGGWGVGGWDGIGGGWGF